MGYIQVYTAINVMMTHINTHTEKMNTTTQLMLEKGWNQMSKKIKNYNEDKLHEAELILETVLDEDASSQYLIALTHTYFRSIRNLKQRRSNG